MNFFSFIEVIDGRKITYFIPFEYNEKYVQYLSSILNDDSNTQYNIDINLISEEEAEKLVNNSPDKYVKLEGIFNWNIISKIQTFDDLDEIIYNGRINTLLIPAVVENKRYRVKRYDELNEEIGFKILSSLKGVLQKAMGSFAAPFKDFADDIKKAFNDPENEGKEASSIKNMLLTNVNQAIDGAQKIIPTIQNESDINAIMENFIKSLIELANGLDADFSKALGKEESIGPKAVAKAVILGNKKANWLGLVGVLQGTTYKFNKTNFDTILAKSAAGKTGKDALNLKIKAAQKFFDDFQKDFRNYINKELNENELQNIFNQAQKIEVEIKFKVGDTVSYKREDFDDSKTAEDQPEMIAKGEVRKIDGNQITIFNFNIKKEIKKSIEDIIIEETEDAGDVNKKAQETLGKIKDDKEKMTKVTKFAEFIQDPKNADKLAEIEKILAEQ